MTDHRGSAGAAQVPRLISNDDGWLISSGEVEATPEAIREHMVGTYEDSPVDTVSWCVGNREVYNHETDVGERFGEGWDHLEGQDAVRKANRERLIEAAGGPLTEITRQFHEAGVGLLASVRMNSHYVAEYASPGFGEFRRRHADCLIGRPDEYIPAPSVEHAIRRGIDYKFPVVREHMEAVVCELFERFDVDGVELDYMRHPAFFRVEEGLACGYLMTDFLGRVRRRLEAESSRRGRRLELLVRVPPTLADSRRLGLDVERWIGEGLVDAVAAGGGFTPFEMPIHEFVAAAEGSACRVYGSLEALRPCVDEAALRALAARWWDAGVDGLYLFNYYSAPREWKQRVLGELADREGLARRGKRYGLDHCLGGKEAHGGAFNHAHPLVSLPVFLEETRPGGGCELTLEIADDAEAAAAAGELDRCVLGLGLEGLAEGDELEVEWNGRLLPWQERRVSHDGWPVAVFAGAPLERKISSITEEGTLIELEAGTPPPRRGKNRLRIRLFRGPDSPRRTVLLKEVRLDIGYREKV